MKNFDIKPRQCAAARALLGWTQAQLAERANIGISTVADFERGARLPIGAVMYCIRMTLLEAGIEKEALDLFDVFGRKQAKDKGLSDENQRR